MKKIVRIVCVVLNVLVATAFMLTTVAGYVAPSRSVVPSLLAFGYLPMLVVNVVFALLWLCFARKEFLISVAAVALRYPLLPIYLQLGGNPTMPEPSDEVLTLMSMNVRQFQGRDADLSQAANNARQFLDLVEQQGPDVLCLQEFAAVKGVAVADSLRFMGYTEQFAAHTASSGLPYGSVIFSKEPIAYVSVIGDGSKIYADIVKHGRTTRVMNVHFGSYRLDATDRQEIDRMAHGDMDSSTTQTIKKLKRTIALHEREWLDDLAPLVKASSVPVVLAGDFNDIPSSYLYHAVSRNLKDAFVEAGRGLGITYNGSDFPTFRIDYVFHSAQLQCIAFNRLRVQLSDHHPIMTAINLNPR